MSKRPEPPHVADVNGLIEAQVDTDLLPGLRRHAGTREPVSGVARGEVHHEEDDRGDAEDEGNGAEEPPDNECRHRPPFTAQLPRLAPESSPGFSSLIAGRRESTNP